MLSGPTHQHISINILNPTGHVWGIGNWRLLLPTPQMMEDDSISYRRTTFHSINKDCRCSECCSYIVRSLLCQQLPQEDTKRPKVNIPSTINTINYYYWTHTNISWYNILTIHQLSLSMALLWSSLEPSKPQCRQKSCECSYHREHGLSQNHWS